MPLRRLLVLALLAALLPATAVAAGPGSTLLIDRPTGLGSLPFDGINDSTVTTQKTLSGDGRYAVFESDADQLLAPGADPRKRHVFLCDRVAGTTVQLDTRTDGTPANGSASAPSISTDGTRVAFQSDATNLTADAVPGGSSPQVFVKTLSTGAVVLASRANGAGGAIADAAYYPILDADGSHVVFLTADNLDPAFDLNAGTDIYLRVPGANTTALQSRGTGAANASGVQFDVPAISGDGSVVAFTTDVTLAGADDVNGQADVYTRSGSTTVLASRVSGGTAAGNSRSTGPALSQNGSVVAFTSTATNLVAGDTNNAGDVFTRSGGTTTLQSRPNGSSSALGVNDSYGAALTPDGSRVAFASASPNLVTGTGPAYEFRSYVRTVGGTSTVLASRADGAAGTPIGGSAPSIGSDGTKVLFGSQDDAAGGAGDGTDDVFVRDTTAGTTGVASIPSGTTVRKAAIGSAQAGVPAVSDDGRYVVFSSGSDAFGLGARLAPAPSGLTHAYLRDLVTNTTRRIDDVPGGYVSGAPIISGDGSTIAYAGSPSVSVTRGFASATNVYVYSVATGTTRVAGVRTDGTTANGAVFAPALSRDGTKVAFRSWATNLDPADADSDEDVYLRDLAAGTTTLVSRRDGAGAPGGNGLSYGASIDSAGRRVAFVSSATDLVTGDANGKSDVFVRDVVAGTTVLVSRASGAGALADQDASAPIIAGDGTKVAFATTATNLGDGGGDPDRDVYLRDLATGTTSLLSRVGAAGPSASANVALEHLSRDGAAVAMTTDAPNLTGVGSGPAQVVVRRLADGATTVGSRADGAGGALAEGAYSASLSADGGCLVLNMEGTALTPGGYASPDYDHVYLRTLSGQCPRPAPVVPGTPTPQPPAPPSPPLPGPDRTAPVLSATSLSPARFSVGALRPARRARPKRPARGSTLRFTLSEAASVTLTADRRERGRRSGSKCVKSTPALVRRKAKACTRYVAKGTVRLTGRSGANRTTFTGKVAGKSLPRGTFRLTVDATDAARNKARARTLTFTIVKG